MQSGLVRSGILRLLSIVLLIACLSHTASASNSIIVTTSLQFGATLESVVLKFRQAFYAPACTDELTDLQRALRSPRTACEVFITSQDPLVIPDTISTLRWLQSLGIDGPSSVSVSPTLWSMGSLTELQIANAGLEFIPEQQIFLPHVINLDLSGNQLASLPASIQSAKKLKNLFLQGNHFSTQTQEQIQAWLPNTNIRFE